MSEGELKKSMQKRLLGHLTDSGETSESEANEVFQGIIEEAKQEFPVKPEFIQDRETRQVITLEYHSLGAKKLTEVIKWYLKWFGAPQ